MLGDLLRYAWHVGRFPCEDIMIGTQKVGELAFLFGQELGPDLHHLGWVSGVDPIAFISSSGWKVDEEVGLLQSGTARVNNSLSHGSSDELMTVVASS